MNLLFLGSREDEPFLGKLKTLSSHKVWIELGSISTWAEIELYCKAKNRQITGIISTSKPLLQKLTYKTNVSINNFAGSWFSRNGIEIIFVNPLEHFITVPYGQFLFSHYVRKLTQPDDWFPATKFSWKLATSQNIGSIIHEFSQPSCFLIAVDIETLRDPLSIRCVGYTAFSYTASGTIHSSSTVFPLNSMEAVRWMRELNSLPAPKALQNGKYDHAYFARYAAPCFNYLFDTINLSHAWYVELPKDLAFITTYFVREAWYWKDMADTTDLHTYYEYCARDTWGTGNSVLAWLMKAPAWARKNYCLEFPVVFPCHLAEMTGIAVGKTELETAIKDVEQKLELHSTSLNTMLGTKNFNTNSPKQMTNLFRILGCQDLLKQDEINIAKAQFRHPLNERILDQVLEIRGLRKLKSTYLDEEKFYDSAAQKNNSSSEPRTNLRLLYALNPHGTDTGRLASKEHHFWTGLQIQNIPRGNAVKSIAVADSGFLFGECDLEQAESRDTAHIAGDEKLIAAVSGTRDFHSVNASAFFGIAYEKIYDDKTRKTLDKPLRDLAKRVNHGANYNMGPDVLVNTMGLKRVKEAQKILGLNKLWEPRKVADYLLSTFHRTYPHLAGTYYPAVVAAVENTQLLIGATGWTRYCFGKPATNKPAKNAYIAHGPQSLNAMALNQAWLVVFYELALNEPENFKLIAQIHDSILFQYRIGHEHLAHCVKEFMEIPVTVKGADGKTRTFVVPAALKLGARQWSDLG